LVSALLGVALFAVSVGGTYIYDDITIIERDERLTDPSRWHRYWTESYNQGVDNLYRPLVSMTYAVQWWLHGDRPWAFHLINVLLHGAASACVAELARRLAGLRAAFVAGLLFAAHPIHVEAVANVVGRAELMCALGVLGALVLFMRPLTPWRAVAITVCFLIAVLSKEQGMLVPLLLLVVALARRLMIGSMADPFPARYRSGRLLLILLLCWLLAGYIVWRESILKFWWDREFIDWTINPMIPNKSHPYSAEAAASRWLMPLVLLGRYAALLVAPVTLSPDYGAKVIGWSVRARDPYLWVGIIAAVSWCALFIVCLVRRWFAWVVALLGLALTYGMVGNIVALIGTNFAERLMYLPSAFFVMLVAMLLSRLPRGALIGVMSIVLVLASARTFTYARLWNDKLVFYRTALENQPGSIRLYMLLASEYAARGQWADAERVVREGTEMLPEYWEIWLHRGDIAMRQGKWDEAQKYFDISMNIRPSIKTEQFIRELANRRKEAG
jgi:hypothetical protein